MTNLAISALYWAATHTWNVVQPCIRISLEKVEQFYRNHRKEINVGIGILAACILPGRSIAIKTGEALVCALAFSKICDNVQPISTRLISNKHEKILESIQTRNISEFKRLSGYFKTTLSNDEQNNIVRDIIDSQLLIETKSEFLSILLTGNLTSNTQLAICNYAINHNQPMFLEKLRKQRSNFNDAEKSELIINMIHSTLPSETKINFLSEMIKESIPSKNAFQDGCVFAMTENQPALLNDFLSKNNDAEYLNEIANRIIFENPPAFKNILNILSQHLTRLKVVRIDFFVKSASRGYSEIFLSAIRESDNLNEQHLTRILDLTLNSPSFSEKDKWLITEQVVNKAHPNNNNIKTNLIVTGLKHFIQTQDNYFTDRLIQIPEFELATSEQKESIILLLAGYNPTSMFVQNLIISLLNNRFMVDTRVKSKALPAILHGIRNRKASPEFLRQFLTDISGNDRREAMKIACCNGYRDLFDILKNEIAIDLNFKDQLIDLCHPSMKLYLRQLPCEATVAQKVVHALKFW